MESYVIYLFNSKLKLVLHKQY